MRETKFIEQNHDKWRELERAIRTKNPDPDQISDLFVQITDDLSYARTFYPNRSIRLYINWLTQRLFFKIYRSKRIKKGSFGHFWTEDLPRVMYESRRELLLSFLVFALAMAIGILSQHQDPGFARTILGDGYVNQTIRNIEKGDPMAIYKYKNALDMAVAIIGNNLWVAFICFVLGVFASVGSIGMLIGNGIMVGVFQYFFVERDLFRESFLAIWTHGAMEISSIILAGAAGIVVGQGLLFPGTYHRMKAFQVTARRGLKIYLGTVPFIIIAGLAESFLTRMTDTPDLVRLLYILVSFGVMLTYFVLYPMARFRGQPAQTDDYPFLMPDTRESIQAYRIKYAGETFSEILVLWRKYFGENIRFIFLTAGVLTVLILGITYTHDVSVLSDTTDLFSLLVSPLSYLMNNNIGQLALMSAFFAMTLYGRHLFEQETGCSSLPGWRRQALALIPVILTLILLYAVRQAPATLLLLAPVTAPFFFSVTVAIFDEPNPFRAFTRGISLVFSRFGQYLALNFLLVAVFTMATLLLGSGLAFALSKFAMMIVPDIHPLLLQFAGLFGTFTTVSIVYLTFTFGAFIQYYSSREADEAHDLFRRIPDIGTQRRIKGIPRE